MAHLRRIAPAAVVFAAGLCLVANPCRGDDPAAEPLAASGVRTGLAVHLDATDGQLTAALRGGGRFLVHGLASNPGDLRRARQFVQDGGLYGPVSLDLRPEGPLPYADNIVNLAVAADLPALLAGGVTLEQIVRVLAPRGVLCFGGQVEQAKLTAAGLTDIRRAGGSSGSQAGRWTVAVKPRSSGMDDWPCFDYAPHGNPVSADTAVGPAASLRWRSAAWAMHTQPFVSGWVSAGGRLFGARRELTPDGHRFRHVLVARDAHNGLVLWQRPLEGPLGDKYGERNVVATPERLYLTLDARSPLVALDAATGRPIREYPQLGRPEQVFVHENRLILSTRARTWAVDVDTAELLWQTDKCEAFVLADGQLFGEIQPRKLACLDAASGQVRWQVEHGLAINRFNSPFHYQGTVVMVKLDPDPEARYRLRVEGFSTRDGTRLWEFRPKNVWRKAGVLMGEVFAAQGLVWVHADVEPDPEKNNAGKRPAAWFGLDPQTGQVRKRHDDATSDEEVAAILALGIHRCNRGRATENYALTGSYEFFDWSTGQFHQSGFTRSTCGSGVGLLPANGLIYAPPTTCVCRAFMQRGGFQAFAHRPDPVPAHPGQRLQRGAAFGQVKSVEPATPPGADDWPCYRRDGQRRGATERPVAVELKQLWETPVARSVRRPDRDDADPAQPADDDGPLTAPTIADGSVFLADRDTHQLVALDAADGRVRWRFTAGGRIDTPPTIAGGLAIFGCRDGCVYCLRADDGELVWSFLAAPNSERIVVDGQLESAWPVHGSVLMLGGVAYVAAGWHSGLDGGVTIYGLRPADGQVVLASRLEKRTGDFRTANQPVALLTTDGTDIYMGRWKIAVSDGQVSYSPGTPLGVVRFGVSGFLDHQWSRFSNTKGRLDWDDGRTSGKLLIHGTAVTCGVQARRPPGGGYGPEGPQLGLDHFSLFGRTSRVDKGWSVQVPLQMRAMVLTGPTVFVAGVPNPPIPELAEIADPRQRARVAAGLDEERFTVRGGAVWAFSAADGATLGRIELPAGPVFDGLAASGGRLFLSCQDGRLRCLGP